MNKILKDFPFTIPYLDDIIIYSKTMDKYLKHLQQVFHKFWDVKLSMKLSKCYFFTKEIRYLHLILNATGINPSHQEYKPPGNAKQL